MTSCHLVADSVEELHAFAREIGLRAEWFQLGGMPHYDLTAGMRAKAIKCGAQQITRERMRDKMRNWRRGTEQRPLFGPKSGDQADS